MCAVPLLGSCCASTKKQKRALTGPYRCTTTGHLLKYFEKCASAQIYMQCGRTTSFVRFVGRVFAKHTKWPWNTPVEELEMVDGAFEFCQSSDTLAAWCVECNTFSASHGSVAANMQLDHA